MAKKSFPLAKAYTLLEPGPVVLLTTASGGQTDVMAQSWHLMLEFEPPLIGCVVSPRNHSYALLMASRECVLNIPSVEMAEQVVACGNASGGTVDKFERFGLTPVPAQRVGAPLIQECFASLECRVVDTDMVARYGLFVLEAVKAWVDPARQDARTLHHRGRGRFMVAGETVQLKSKMK